MTVMAVTDFSADPVAASDSGDDVSGVEGDGAAGASRSLSSAATQPAVAETTTTRNRTTAADTTCLAPRRSPATILPGTASYSMA
jgi:hypothetical protein